jgi:hypothetical protein
MTLWLKAKGVIKHNRRRYINNQKNYGKKKSHSKGEEKAEIGTKIPNYSSIDKKKDG